MRHLLLLSTGILAKWSFLDETVVSKRLRDLCPCSQTALSDIQYTLEKSSYMKAIRANNDEDVALLVSEIKNIAYNCTKRPECRCPDGYFKTIDGMECLRIGRELVDCAEAEQICANDFNARLAVAKDSTRLVRLSDVLRQTGNNDDYFWLGLAYNRTEYGMPMWKWSDHTYLTQDMKRHMELTEPFKKSAQLRMIELGGVTGPIERVAINSGYKGKTWQQESCLSEGPYGSQRALHKYICEFMMFKVNLKPRSNNRNP